MASKDEPAKPESAQKEAIPRGSITTTLSGMQNQRVLWADPEIAGYLEKRGGRFTSWKRRYFILQGYFLYYFISEQQTETPLGLIPVEGCTIKETADVGGKLRRYVFYLNVGSQHVGFAKADTYILAAASRESLEEWTEKLVLAAENREELYGDLRCARAVVGEIQGLLALSQSEQRLFASVQGDEARALQLELKRACTEMDEIKREIEAVSIEADRQESALLQQLVLWDIMSLTDPGREPNEDYQTLTRLQAEVRYSDEIYRLLYKKGSLFQGDGIQDLKRECRAWLVNLVRQVLDLIEDHHAKIRSKAPRYSFNVDPAIYEDMFYVKVPAQDEEQIALELLAKASKVEEDSDDEAEEVEEERRATTVKPGAARSPASPGRQQLSIAQTQRTSPRASKLQVGPLPRLFPEQRAYQLTRSASRGWQVAPIPGSPAVAVSPPLLRKRTHFYENPNVLGSVVTGRTITNVAEEETEEDEEEEASTRAHDDPMRRRIQGIHPIFISHFGPETRPPASQVKHDPVSTKPVPATIPDTIPGAPPQPYSRPNVLAYIKGTIPRAKSVRPLKPSEIAAMAEAAAKLQRQSVTPPRTRPSTPDIASTSKLPPLVLTTTTTTEKPTGNTVVAVQGKVLARPGPSATYGGEEATSTSGAAALQRRRSSPTRTVKFADEDGHRISITAPGAARKASFINIDPEALERRPSYGRIRDFPVVVPPILNSAVGLTFPENEELFSPLSQDPEPDNTE